VNQSGKTATVAMMTASVLAAIASGCGMNRNYANNQIRQLPHSKVAIEYTVGETAVTSASAETTGGESSLLVANTDKKVLSVTYPHPNPKYARRYAEVTLREVPTAGEETADKLAKQLVTNPFRQREAANGSDNSKDGSVLRTVVNREDLEFLLRDLVADSFFDREERRGSVDLSVTLGSRTVQKQWDHIKSFDELAARVVADNAKRTKQRRPATRTAGAELLAPTLDADETDDEPIPPSNGKSREPSKF
jgi:hypothetical protein